MSENSLIKKKEILYSHAGKVSSEKLSYLLDRKSHIDKILAGKKRTKIVETDFINKEESYDDLEDQINDIEEEDIFTNEYEAKHISEINDQKLKYFSNVKNPCTFIESKVNNKVKAKNKLNQIKEREMTKEAKAKEELKKLIHNSNKFNYYYHLLHHTDNSNYFSEDNNMIILGPEVNATRYNPKLEFIYKKIIYSPSFKLMSGRYDQQFLTKTVKNRIENNKIKKRERERKKRKEKIREIVNSKIDTIYKSPTFYNQKNNDFIKNNEKIRELKELKRSQSLIVDSMVKDKILGDVEMEKQLQRGTIPEHHDVRIRNEKAFNFYLDKGYNKTFDQIGNNSNSIKGSMMYDNNTLINEQSLINNKDNSNINNNSSNNNENETIYTSNALKNELVPLYNTNTNNNNESNNNNNSNLNLEKYPIRNNGNNVELNNKYLTMKINNYNKNFKNNTIFKKLNSFKRKNFFNINDPKKTVYTSSASNIFNNDNIDKNSIKMNKTTSNNLFQRQDNNNNSSNNINSSLNNINPTTIKGITFDKMLSREYLDNLYYEEEPLHPQVNPRYNLVQPKCIMKVVYSNRKYNIRNVKRFEGLGEEVTFDADKIFYKYNDHFPTKSFYFNKMTGRSTSIDGYLPSFMVNLGNRNSCLSFNDKSLKLNNFSEGKLKEQRSSFNQHKSFNWKLNMNLLNFKEINKQKEGNSDINKIFRKIKEGNSVRNIKRKKIFIPGQPFLSVSLKSPSNRTLPEFYRVNLDMIERNKEFYKNKIDGITLKTNARIKDSKKLLNNHEKKLFLVNSSIS